VGRPQSDDERAIADDAKIRKIRSIRNDNSDWDRKTPKSEDERAMEDSRDIKLYDEIFGED
jgi:hypothetical protein